MLMYFLMFLSVIKLRLKAPHHFRAFRIPGGMFGIFAVAGIGMVGVLTTLVVSFIPPDGIDIGSISRYESTLVSGLLLMCLPPFISSWVQARRAAVSPTLAI